MASTKVKKIKSKKPPVLPPETKPEVVTPSKYSRLLKLIFWFVLGTILGFFFFVSFLYITYRANNTNKVYEGVFVNGVDFSGKSPEQVESYFAKRNKEL